MPQVGRVIIQDDVEIGADTTIDRGAIRDTVIGEGTKIDNLVQIGHNVEIGRHCVIVAQTGISGSVDARGLRRAGRRGSASTITSRSARARSLPRRSVVHGDVPPGARWGGMPAKPMKHWFREMTWLARLARAQRRTPANAAARARASMNDAATRSKPSVSRRS